MAAVDFPRRQESRTGASPFQNSTRFGEWVPYQCFGLHWKEERARPSDEDTNRAPGQLVSPSLGALITTVLAAAVTTYPEQSRLLMGVIPTARGTFVSVWRLAPPDTFVTMFMQYLGSLAPSDPGVRVTPVTATTRITSLSCFSAVGRTPWTVATCCASSPGQRPPRRCSRPSGSRTQRRSCPRSASVLEQVRVVD